MIAVRIDSVRKAFPGTQALSGCSLEFHAGECHGLVGENGAGKSTLMKIIAGAETSDSGTIELFGSSVRFQSPRESRLAGISAIYQELELIPELSVAENVFLGREPRLPLGRLDRPRLLAETRQLIERLGHHISPDLRVAKLNLAEKQLVEIARALAAEAKVFLMDEPTAALGDRDRESLFAVIRRLTAGGAAVVFISHRLEEVLEICDRVTVMRDGRVVLSAPAGSLSREQLIVAMAGEQRAATPHAAHAQRQADAETVLESRALCSSTGLRNVNIKLRKAEIVVATGLAGSGRTRLLRALFGADPIQSGEILLGGKAFRPGSPARAAAAGIGFLGEERRQDGLIPDRGVRFNVSLPSLARFRGPLRLLNRRAESVAVNEQAAAVAVKAASIDVPIRMLSGGNQQKALLARWLLAGSRVLLLDEPTRGVDINAKNELYRLLRRQADAGLALLVTTSELPEALLLADRILVMRDGAVVAELDRAEANTENLLRLAVGDG